VTVEVIDPAERPGLLTAAPVRDVLALQQAFLELSRALLDESDYQRIGSKDFKKKSAWRKLAAAFNVSDTMLERNYDRRDDGRIVRCEVVVRATAPNGRSAEGLGLASIYERKFNNPEHDIPATAHTRAKNRAFSDLFGLGEVSAEEIDVTETPARATPPKRAGKRTKAPEYPLRGDAPAAVDGTAELEVRLMALSLRNRDTFRSWRKSRGLEWPPATTADLMAATAEVTRIEAEAALEADTYEPPIGSRLY
jgi:hypothetical protein